MFKIKLYNIESKKVFYKTFDTEYEKNKFISKLKYSKKLILLD